MKKLSFAAVLAGMLFSGVGCYSDRRLDHDFGASVAYSSRERGYRTDRNWDLEGKMAVEDMDRALLLDPVSSLTIWNVR